MQKKHEWCMYTEKDYVRTQCEGMTAKTILEKKSKVGGFTLLEFIVYYKAAVIKTTKYWPKERPIDQRNQEINSCTCGQLIFSKGAKKIQYGKKIIFLINDAGQLDLHIPNNKFHLYLDHMQNWTQTRSPKWM